MIALGIVRCGSLTSSPAVETASSPMNEKKIPPVATQMPLTPKGAKSARLLVFQPVTPTTTKSISTLSLITTITAFALADSLAPRMRSNMHSMTSTIAGTLMMPPSSGEKANASGIWKPNRLFSSWLTYCDHPTETAALDTPYSSRRHAATTMATPSPRVA